MTEVAALPIEGKVEVVPVTRRTSDALATTAAAVALATAEVVAEGEPNDEVGRGTEKTSTGVAEVAAPATLEAEVEAMGDEGVAQGAQSARAGGKIGAGAEVGGGDTALRLQGRVRGPVAKTETDET